MSKDKAPREFWIDIDDNEFLTAYRYEPNDAYQKFHVIEKSYVIELEAKLAECVAVLELIIPYAEMGVPDPGHYGSCTPESMCDMTCSDSFHGANAIYSARECLAKVKK